MSASSSYLDKNHCYNSHVYSQNYGSPHCYYGNMDYLSSGVPHPSLNVPVSFKKKNFKAYSMNIKLLDPNLNKYVYMIQNSYFRPLIRM